MEIEELEPEGCLSEQEAARRLGISRFVLFRERKRGAIGHYRFRTRVAYSPAHLREYLEKSERPAKAAAA